MFCFFFFFFKQKTAYEMRISDWSSDVCSSDLDPGPVEDSRALAERDQRRLAREWQFAFLVAVVIVGHHDRMGDAAEPRDRYERRRRVKPVLDVERGADPRIMRLVVDRTVDRADLE